MSSFDYPTYPYRPGPEQLGETTPTSPVIVIGAGPVGLTLAIDLGQRGIPVVLLDDDDTVSHGSRAICWSKRTLEIFDRLGLAGPLVARGINWRVGRVFRNDREVYRFDLLPEAGHKLPAFINLQQYHVEQALIEAVPETVDLRFRHKVVAVSQDADRVTLTVETPDGRYTTKARYVVAADGAHSTARAALGLSFEGRVFDERFLIADVKMKADFPTERWFWFDPPFHRGGSTLLHRQADDIWRIDFQLGPEADPAVERQPDRVLPRLKAMLGPEVAFDLEWVSIYTFRCRRMQRFRHGRIFFAGDSAHQVSPFGARGGNGGIQDVDNLAWKLAAVLSDQASDRLLDSYDDERVPATDDNILNSTRSTDFITPKTAASRAFRDAVLSLAEEAPFARALVNSGRLSTPHAYDGSPLSTPDGDPFTGGPPPGAPCPDAPIAGTDGQSAWLLNQLGGDFAVLTFMSEPIDTDLRQVRIGGTGGWADPEGLVARRYDLRPGTCYLIRPDQHVAARWRQADGAKIRKALQRARAAGGPTVITAPMEAR
ncbi:MAG: FAD-dependent oxidoreductase [Pseudomonadota bacterium]